MSDKIRMTSATALVLRALANGYHHGFDIMDVTQLPSGTVYPILRRLERFGLARSCWEDQEVARTEQRPPRRYYDITGDGESTLADALKRFHSLEPIRPKQSLDPAQSEV